MTNNEERTPMEQAAIALYFHAAQMIKEGLSEEEVIENLTNQGVSRETAEMMMRRIETSRDNVTKRFGTRNVISGAVVTALGLLLWFGPFDVATDILRQSVGFIIFGIGSFVLVRGLLQVSGL